MYVWCPVGSPAHSYDDRDDGEERPDAEDRHHAQGGHHGDGPLAVGT